MAVGSEQITSLILAAGMGTRLMPYTRDVPKCMVPLAGRPLIEYQLKELERAGIENITIVGGYRAEALNALGKPVVVNDAFETTNMVWSMMCARHLFDGKHTVIVSYGDIVYDDAVLSCLLAASGDVTVVSDSGWERLWKVRMDNPLEDVETFLLNDDGTLRELGGKPDSYDEVQGQYIGLLKFSPESHRAVLQVFDRLKSAASSEGSGEAFRNMYMTDFIQHIVDSRGGVNVAWIDGGWLEVDTVSDKEAYERLYHKEQLGALCRLMAR